MYIHFTQNGLSCIYICVCEGYPSTLFIFVIVETYWNSTKKMTVFIDFEKSFIYLYGYVPYIFTLYCSWVELLKRLVVEDCLFSLYISFLFFFFLLYIFVSSFLFMRNCITIFYFCLTCIIMLNKDSYFVLHTCNVESFIAFYFFQYNLSWN